MPIKQVQRYEVSCDGCGDDLMTWEGWHPLYETEADAIDGMDEYDWTYGEDARSLCPGCQERTEE